MTKRKQVWKPEINPSMGSCWSTSSGHHDVGIWRKLPKDIVARLCQEYLKFPPFHRLDRMLRFRTSTVRFGAMATLEESYVFHKMFPCPTASGWMVSASHCWTPHALDWNFGFHRAHFPGARLERVEEVQFVHPHDGSSCFVGIWKPVPDHHILGSDMP